jgi:hypothetical protein
MTYAMTETFNLRLQISRLARNSPLADRSSLGAHCRAILEGVGKLPVFTTQSV